MPEYDAPGGDLSSMSTTDNSQPASLKVLFVCTGNICRSPTAEGVFRAMVDATGLAGRIDVDSVVGRGTRFRLVVPREAQRPADSEEAAPAAMKGVT